MKKNKLILILAVIISSIFLFNCEDRNDLTAPAEVNTGTADFTRFVSIGNSLTAGYQSGALYEDAQDYSFGKMIADQVGASYEQPIVSNPGIGGRIEIATLVPFVTSTQPVDAGVPTNLGYAGIYNNLGIPGILLADVLLTNASPSQFVGANPFIDIVLRGQGKTVLESALADVPTFAAVWIGNNDILGYATSGGVYPHTPTETFGQLYSQLVGALAQAGVKGVVANIPNVKDVPFFTTVGASLMEDSIYVVIGTKSDGTVAPIDLTKNLLTLKAQAELAVGKGTSFDNPLSNSVILDEDEIVVAEEVTASFNASIAGAATAFGFTLVDVNDFFRNVSANGYVANGLTFTTQYIHGGLFSLDGVHPTSQGYAVIANKFIESINSSFQAKIPQINVSTIPGSLDLAKSVIFYKNGIPTFEAGTFDGYLF